MAWAPFRSGFFSTPEGAPAERRGPPSPVEEAAPPRPRALVQVAPQHVDPLRQGSFDAIGQRGEVIRMRVSEMAERLDDLKSLQDDFLSVLDPLMAISEELPRATTRLAEVEALFAKEQQGASASRREVGALQAKAAATANDLAAMTAEVARLETVLHGRDIELEQLRVGWRDRSLTAENLERQLAAEVEQVKVLSSETKSLRLEAQAVDQALSRSEHDLTEARERLEMLTQEGRRTQALCEEQERRLADGAARYEALKGEADAERQSLHAVEAELAREVAARQKAETQAEAEIAALRAERASLAMKLEAAANRGAATEQLLAQTRGQLRDKDEAFRAAERAAKEAAIDRTTADRRLDGVQEDLSRQTDRLLEAQRIRSDLDGRCDMLTKALAAKDVAIEQATGRAAALSERIDQLNRRRESELHELEMANRRLVEELESERSERALAQGALDIARESRISLQKQHVALKRSIRGFGAAKETDPSMTDGPGEEGESEGRDGSNVRPFAPAQRPNP